MAEGAPPSEPQEPDRGEDETQALPASVDQALAEASGPMVRVPLDAEQRQRVAEAQVSQLETAASQAADDRALRKRIAGTATKAAFIQVGIADIVFVIYGFWNGWDIPGGTMNAWLGATVVQVIAVALVVARSLFPSRDRNRASAIPAREEGG